MTVVHENALLFADGRIRHGCQHAAAVDCGHTSCRTADTQYVDHRPAAHSTVRVDRRTQILRTRKTTSPLIATYNPGRRPQHPEWPSATEGRTADGERQTGKVTRGNKLANWTVPIKRR